MHLKIFSGKWRPLGLGLNVLRVQCVERDLCTAALGNCVNIKMKDNIALVCNYEIKLTYILVLKNEWTPEWYLYIKHAIKRSTIQYILLNKWL